MRLGFSQPMVEPLLAWYKSGHRALPWRESPTPYHVWVSEIMLQQTRVEAVKRYYERWMEHLPTVEALAAADEEVYLKLWEGLGYYSRVRNLHKAAVQVCEEYSGVLPNAYEKLLKLPGIGEYTAGAIASIAFGVPVPAIDGNVFRVATRMDNDPTPVTSPAYKKALRERMLTFMPEQDAGDFNQALMELGAMVCAPNGLPKCDVCPVMHLCLAQAQKTFHYLPVKERKKPRRLERYTVLIIKRADEIVIEKRPAKGLLAGMWQFPMLEGHASVQAVQEAVCAMGYHPTQVFTLAPSKHIFTHIEWHMIGYEVTVDEAPVDALFVPYADMAQAYSLPSAFKCYTAILRNEYGQA